MMIIPRTVCREPDACRLLPALPTVALAKVGCLLPVSYINVFNVIHPRVPLIYLKIKGSDKRCKLDEAKVPGIKIGLFLKNKISDIAEVSPAIFVGQISD
jgi:hypothetical protein